MHKNIVLPYVQGLFTIKKHWEILCASLTLVYVAYIMISRLTLVRCVANETTKHMPTNTCAATTVSMSYLHVAMILDSLGLHNLSC